jgi:hypothetical protein
VVCLLVEAAANAQLLQATALCGYVQFALPQKYHSATNLLREKYNENYMAIWKDDIAGESYTIPDTTTGCLIHVVKATQPIALPNSVLGNLKKQFKAIVAIENCKVADLWGNLFYEILLKDYNLSFDAKGKFLYRQMVAKR